MSVLSALNKPISFKPRSTAKTPSVAKASKSPLVVGPIPRADLLPPSVTAEKRVRRGMRVTTVAVIACAVIAVTASGAAWFASDQAARALATENEQTGALLASQSSFAEVSGALASIDRLTAARAAVGADDIVWVPYLDSINALLPAGATPTSIRITAATPTIPLTETAPGVTDQVASILYSVSADDLSMVQEWILALPDIAGYRDAALKSVGSDSGRYTAQVEIAVGPEALSGRFAVPGSKATPPAAEKSADGTGGN